MTDSSSFPDEQILLAPGPLPSASADRTRQTRLQKAVAEGMHNWRQRIDAVQRPRNGVAAAGNGQALESLDNFQPLDIAGPDAALELIRLDGLSLGSRHGMEAIDPDLPGFLARMPRRKFFVSEAGDKPPPKMRVVSYRASLIRALGRLFVWLSLFVFFMGGTAWDRLRGRDRPERRAKRLRRAFERAGGTFVKIGQHLALRLDFLPWAYSVELARMLDVVPPFPVEQAIAIIEKSTGQPLAESFAKFDPEPTSSTSIACTYQAVRHTGEKVVVRVRRPGVGELFMADIRVLNWLLMAIEFLTILRPGITYGMRGEFRETLLSELDFVLEARVQDSFRRVAKRTEKNFFTAPRIHFDLSGEELIVEEFASGIWLWELLAAVEQNDERVLGLAQRLNIDPAKVAKRLMWVNYWGWDDNLFFNGNPHPDNIIIGRNSKLVFTDFSQIIAVDRTKRRALQQNMYSIGRQDALNMARASLILLEPLPPIDVNDITKELESYNWQLLYILASKEAGIAWSERTTALQWIGLINVARKYSVTIDSTVLRIIRAILLYGTLAARLYSDLDVVKEFERYTAYSARKARRRVTEKVAEQLSDNPDEKIFIRLERLAHTTEGLYFRLHHMLTIPSVSFHVLMGKWSFVVSVILKFLAQAAGVTVVAMALLSLPDLLAGNEAFEFRELFAEAVSNRVYQLFILLLVVINGRNILFRLDDKQT